MNGLDETVQAILFSSKRGIATRFGLIYARLGEIELAFCPLLEHSLSVPSQVDRPNSASR